MVSCKLIIIHERATMSNNDECIVVCVFACLQKSSETIKLRMFHPFSCTNVFNDIFAVI